MYLQRRYPDDSDGVVVNVTLHHDFHGSCRYLAVGKPSLVISCVFDNFRSYPQQRILVDVFARLQVAVFLVSARFSSVPPWTLYLARAAAVYGLENDRLSVHHAEALHVKLYFHQTAQDGHIGNVEPYRQSSRTARVANLVLRTRVQRLNHLAGVCSGNELDGVFCHNALVLMAELHVVAHGFLQFCLRAFASQRTDWQGSTAKVEDFIAVIFRRFSKRLAAACRLSVAGNLLGTIICEFLCGVFLHVAERSAVCDGGYDGNCLSIQFLFELLPSH